MDKQQILNTIIDGLNTDPYRVVRINNIDTGAIICNNFGKAEMTEAEGGVNEYFNKVFISGVNNISIVRRKRNGSGFKATSEPVVTFKLSSSGQVQNDTPMQPTQNIPPANINNSGQLFGSMQGLFGSVPPMDLVYKVQRYNEILQENSELRAENKSLKKDNEDLERQKMKDEYDINRRAGNKELFDTIANIAGPALVGFITKGGAIAEPVGMGAPAQEVSQVKKQLFDMIAANNDNIANYMIQTLYLMNTNPEFGNALIKLIQDHKKQNNEEQ